MSTRYQSGTATGPTDLVQQLVTWLVAGGWTQDMSQSDGSGWRAHLHKSGFYINLRAYNNESAIWAGGEGYPNTYGVALYAGTGFNSGNGWNAQAGAPVGSGQTYNVGSGAPFTSSISITGYYFFDDGNGNIIVVVERSTGSFVHFGWGNLTKASSFTGGAYFFGVAPGYYDGFPSGLGGYNQSSSALCPCCDTDCAVGSYCSAFVRADVDSFTSKWLGVANACPNAPAQGYTGKNAASSVLGGATASQGTANIPHYGNFIGRQTSAQNAQANLLPVNLFAARDAGGWSLLGSLPAIFATNAVGNGYAAKDEIQIGSSTYKLFPNFAVQKS